MPPPTPNIGQLISRNNTGPFADVAISAIGAHAPATLSNHSGNLSSSSNGQTISAKNVSGQININHDNVTVINCKAVKIRIAEARKGTKIYWCEFGITSGLIENTWGTTQIQGGDYTIVRCKLYGGIDHTRPNWGNTKVVENWFGPPFSDPVGHNVGNGDERAHCDPFQPHNPPGGATWDSLLIQGNRFDIFPFNKGQDYLDELNRIQGGNLTGNIGGWPATFGSLNAEYGTTKNVTIRDNYFDGNYYQFIGVQNQKNQGGAPKNVVFIDNILKKRRPNWGASGQTSATSGGRFCNIGGTAGSSTITWGRNLNADTGDTVACQYTGKANGTVLQPGPSSQYATFYGPGGGGLPDGGGDDGGGSENTVVALKVTTPTAGSTHLSGTVVFIGGADTTADPPDTPSNYHYINYYIQSEDGTLGKTHLDRDASENNTGVTLTATSNGVTFTRRGASTPESHPAGNYKLIIEGERKDGTRPSASITVTFGEEEEPEPVPTNIQFNPSIPVLISGRVRVSTATGGVPRHLVQTARRRVPATWRSETYLQRKDTQTEVVDLGDIIVNKEDLQ